MIEQPQRSPLPPASFAPAGDGGLVERQPFLCFQRRAPGDVLVEGVKIAGSAQRRYNRAVLQHGSVLLARSAAAPELAGLCDLTGKSITADELREAWCETLAAALPINWHEAELSDEQRQRAVMLATHKYACSTWTQRLRNPQPLTSEASLDSI
jgi:lipoate-protein ligase A